MTTGDPGTQAAVTNSGTDQAAVLDFTIPRGDTGTAAPLSLLAAYSIPSQGLASDAPITFDQNALSYGTDISHTAGSGTFTVNTPGVYLATFHGVISSASEDSFPVTLVTSLLLNGSIVPGASVPFIYQTATELSDQSLTIPVAVSSVPATFQVSATGGNYLADAVTLTLLRLGDIPT